MVSEEGWFDLFLCSFLLFGSRVNAFSSFCSLWAVYVSCSLKKKLHFSYLVVLVCFFVDCFKTAPKQLGEERVTSDNLSLSEAIQEPGGRN